MTSNSVRVGRVHACKCPLNPRNRGAAASPCKTNTESQLIPMRCGGAQSDTPINMNPLLAQKQRLIVAHMDCPDTSTISECKTNSPNRSSDNTLGIELGSVSGSFLVVVVFPAAGKSSCSWKQLACHRF